MIPTKVIKVTPETFPNLVQDVANAGHTTRAFAKQFVDSTENGTDFYVAKSAQVGVHILDIIVVDGKVVEDNPTAYEIVEYYN